MIKSVLDYLSNQGAVVQLRDGLLTIDGLRSWKDRELAIACIEQIYKIALVYDVMLSPITPTPDADRCPFCTKYRQYYCQYHKSTVKIPTATFRHGCENFSYNKSVYF